MTFDDWWNKIVGNGQWTTLERLAAHQAWYEGRAYALREAAELAAAWIGERIQMNDKMEYVLTTEYNEGSFRAAILGDHVPDATKMIDCPACGRKWDVSRFNSCQCGASIENQPPPDILMDARQEKLHEDLPGRRSVKAVIKDEPPYYETICGMLGCSGLDDKCPGNKECKILRKITNRSSSPCPTCSESVDGAPDGTCCGQCREEDER